MQIMIMNTAVCLNKGIGTETQVIREISWAPLLVLSDS